jgi:hypothetical protein
MSDEEHSSEPPDTTTPNQPGRVSKRKSPNPEEALKPVVKEIVSEFQLAMRSESIQNPIVEKITANHIDQLLAGEERDREREHERQKLRIEERREKQKFKAERESLLMQTRMQRDHRQMISITILAILILLLVFALCWLFLYFGQQQYIVTVLTSVFAFAGGIGVGRSIAKPQKSSKGTKGQAE